MPLLDFLNWRPLFCRLFGHRPSEAIEWVGGKPFKHCRICAQPYEPC